MKKYIFLFAIVTVFGACQKENPIRQLSFPNFSASVNGTKVEFMSPVTAESVKNSRGTYDLKIIGENRISNDSSVSIWFIIPDFTLTNTASVNHTLNTTFNGNLGEWKSVPGSGSVQGKLHYFQSGQLSVQQDENKYLKGSFNFTYFLFDGWGNKTGEVVVTNGTFSDVIIER